MENKLDISIIKPCMLVVLMDNFNQKMNCFVLEMHDGELCLISSGNLLQLSCFKYNDKNELKFIHEIVAVYDKPRSIKMGNMYYDTRYRELIWSKEGYK